MFYSEKLDFHLSLRKIRAKLNIFCDKICIKGIFLPNNYALNFDNIVQKKLLCINKRGSEFSQIPNMQHSSMPFLQ